MKKKILIGIGIVAVIAVFVVLNLGKEGSKVTVRAVKVQRQDITKHVSASGRIQPKRQVHVSASAIGKITRLAIKEGDRVEKGDFLLQIDPIEYQSMVDQLEASKRSAQATLDMERANLAKAEYDLGRSRELHKKNVVSEEVLRTAQLNVDVYSARTQSATQTLAQHEANLRKAVHDLREVRITASMAGVITTLNVEEGENAIMGTLNNSGTALLTIADLSEIEAEVEVDETEVVFVHVGQGAVITLDAYPDSSFAGVVTEVGNSAIRNQVGFGQSSVDFKVVVAIRDVVPNVRPGLSASVRIKVAEEKNVLAVPIQCLTVRRQADLESTAVEEVGDGALPEDDEDIEGVFVVEAGKVVYREVQVGIAGSKYFHIHSGLEEGETVISGPFKAINELKNGDPVKIDDRSS